MHLNALVRRVHFLAAVLFFFAVTSMRAGSFYTRSFPDAKAVTVAAPTGGDDTKLLQDAINKVQETTGQGIVFVAPGSYHVTNTVYIWPGIRVIGYGPTRPVFVLPENTPGFQDEANEKLMIFFAGRRPRQRDGQSARGPVADASPGTFYSAMANIDFEIRDGNAGAVCVRSHYAQHCFLAHMDFHLGPALAGIHEAGNVVEDLHFYGGRHGVWTGKPSPSWQFTMVDCAFEGQHEAAILEREAGLTLVRPHFLRVPTAVEIETNGIDELWVKDARLEKISGPAFVFGVEENPRNEINMEGVTCRNVPVFASLRDSGKHFDAPGENYGVKTFSHGLHYADLGAQPEFVNVFDAAALTNLPPPVASDIAPLPPQETWVNVRDFGAKGDGTTDDTEAFRKAIATNRAIYVPSGFYIIRHTLELRPDTALIGLHPGATQLIIPDGAEAFKEPGAPRALIAAPKGGSNILFGIGLYTSGNNPRAVAALWKAGTHSMLNDVRFLGGHGTPRSDGGRENPYNGDHSADPNPNRHWNSENPSLWVTDGGGGTFFDIWTPSTFARAGMFISNTETEGRVYEISSEHHVKNEIEIHNAAHWHIYALQTEEERGESGLALPVEISLSHDITIANFHCYRVISSFQPYPTAVKISHSRDIHFRNFHCYSNSKVSFDAGIFDPAANYEIREHEFSWLDITGRTPSRYPHGAWMPARLDPSTKQIGSPMFPETPHPAPLLVSRGEGEDSRPVHASGDSQAPETSQPAQSPLADGAKVEKLAGGFYNISGGAAGPDDFYFVDAHSNHVYRWNISSRQLSTVSNASTLSPVNLALDRSGNVMIVSYNDAVYSIDKHGSVTTMKASAAADPPSDARIYLPVSDWISNHDSLSHPAARYVSVDGSVILPVGQDFLDGATSWGVKSSPPIRTFGLAMTSPGKTFYVTEESGHTTYAADVGADGSLKNFRLFANRGGENVVSDSEGNVYIADGQIYVYDRDSKELGVIEVPERPVQMVFGGPDGKTMFIAARSSLYAVRMR